MQNDFLPVSPADMQRRGWAQLDVILITGDAYVDHPAYGVALIGRVLESNGYRVGVIAQPDWRTAVDFMRLGRPRLFFGITSGNVDSMVANYTANKRPRKKDDYSPGGKPGLRPDRALIVYANRVRQAFKDVPVVVGGIEASMRRLAHYDYWDNRVRRSILFDARADMLVYGMGEPQVVEIARRLSAGETIDALDHIPGTAVIRKDPAFLKEFVTIPSCEAVSDSLDQFNRAFALFYREQNPVTARPVVQAHGDRYAVVYPPPAPLSPTELDAIYELDYQRGWHPDHDAAGGIQGLETVRHSLVTHRGCSGECNFCSLYFHQGRMVQSRSADSIVREATTAGPGSWLSRHHYGYGRPHGQPVRGRLSAMGQKRLLPQQALHGAGGLPQPRSRLRQKPAPVPAHPGHTGGQACLYRQRVPPRPVRRPAGPMPASRSFAGFTSADA
jgi:uncharacterized radical SAM protein YgiQ